MAEVAYERENKRASGLPCGNYLDIDWRQMEGFDIKRDLMPGTKRFGELKKSIGTVSQKELTAQLRDMEANRLVRREVYAEVPPRVEYSLTELGQSLKPILDAMWNWGEDYKNSVTGN